MLNRLGYYSYRFKYKYAPSLYLDTPVDVTLELSSICNCSCYYCYHNLPNPPFKKKLMPLDIAQKIIFDAANLCVNALKFNWRGESTMHPDFKEITAYAKSFASGTRFVDRISNTNMKFSHNNENIFKGLCNQSKVKISFDSFNKEVYLNQRNGSNFDLVLANIHKLYNYKKRDNVIVIQAVRTRANKDEDLEFEVKSRWQDVKLSVRDMVSGRVEKNLDQLEINKRDFTKRKRCIQAFARLIFTSEGDATVCCPDLLLDLKLGNIKDKTIQELFNSEKAKNLRKALTNKSAFITNPCLNCSSFESFVGHKHVWNS